MAFPFFGSFIIEADQARSARPKSLHRGRIPRPGHREPAHGSIYPAGAFHRGSPQPASRHGPPPWCGAGYAMDCGTHGHHGGAKPPRHLGGDERTRGGRRYQPGQPTAGRKGFQGGGEGVKGGRRSALQLYASPTGSQTLLRDWTDTPLASAPLGLKSFDYGHCPASAPMGPIWRFERRRSSVSS